MRQIGGMTTAIRCAAVAAAAFAPAFHLAAQELSPSERTRIDSVATAILAATGAPSASIAIVRGGQLVYERAYGDGRDGVPATPSMRYSIGSVSKQFTAAAVLLLAQDGRLSLDDKVSQWFPTLTRAGDITIRHLLSMTSGYQDYWPQDYVFSAMQRPVTSDEIMRQWAGKALDFGPGTKWQYSNTNYTIAAAIVERASGMPFMQFLRQRIFTPLGMTTVVDFDAGPLASADAAPFLRNALGPLRAAPKEGRGWLFGAGQLAMTARDLARWNIALMDRALLSPASHAQLERDTPLATGLSTGYGLGVNTQNAALGGRRLSHGGAVSGYTTTNHMYPDARTSVTVFTNIYPGGGGANSQIAGRILQILFGGTDTAVVAARNRWREQMQAIYAGLARGTIDRALFTDNANAFFTAEVLADYDASLRPLGTPTEFTAGGESLRGGLTIRSYTIRAAGRVLSLTAMIMPDGRIEQFIVERSS
jgi:D-alanyl-D-alanine carboxypeptidase